MKILKNTLERITGFSQRYQGSPPNTLFYGLEAYGTQLEVARLKISEFFH